VCHSLHSLPSYVMLPDSCAAMRGVFFAIMQTPSKNS
jgi:hypothetical protein